MNLLDKIDGYLNEETDKLNTLKGSQFEKAIIDYVKKEAKGSGFFGQFLQNILGDEKNKNWFFSEVKKEKIGSFEQLDKFLSDNKYFRNLSLDENVDYDLITEADKLEGIQYTYVLFGGSIGDRIIRTLKILKGENVLGDNVYNTKEEAQEKVKRMNKLLSPGEKKVYKLKYVVAELEDGVYTGN